MSKRTLSDLNARERFYALALQQAGTDKPAVPTWVAVIIVGCMWGGLIVAGMRGGLW